MSEYTTQIRYVLEQTLRDAGIDEWMDEDNWPLAWKVFGLDDYPIVDETHRDVLNTKIVRRYMFREIGQETVALFRFMVRRHMHEVMPYYNMLFETMALIDDPLSSFDVYKGEKWGVDTHSTGHEGTHDTTDRTSHDASRSDTSTSETMSAEGQEDREGSKTDDARQVFSDTPMSLLDNEGDVGPTVSGLDYATTVTFEHEDGSDSETVHTSDRRDVGTHGETSTGSESASSMVSKGEKDDSEDVSERGKRVVDEHGRKSPQADMVDKYRDAWYNVDLMVVDSLNGFFMMVY